MARIRSIKPEFWSDGKVASLPKPTALFFISLWNFAEDNGVITDDARSLSLRVPIFRSQDVDKMLNALWKEGLIKRSPSDGLVLITNWKHQKIDKPRDGKVNVNEINWLTFEESSKDIEQSPKPSRKDRIGKDSIGSDRIIAAQPEKPSADSADAEIKKLASQLIARYCELWKAKYKTNVSMSGKWAGNAKTLIKDHGLNRSLELVESFMEMNEHVWCRHSFEQILLKLATISHYAGTGVQISKTQINQLDKSQANKAAGEDAAAYFRKKEMA